MILSASPFRTWIRLSSSLAFASRSSTTPWSSFALVSRFFISCCSCFAFSRNSSICCSKKSSFFISIISVTSCPICSDICSSSSASATESCSETPSCVCSDSCISCVFCVYSGSGSHNTVSSGSNMSSVTSANSAAVSSNTHITGAFFFTSACGSFALCITSATGFVTDVVLRSVFRRGLRNHSSI